MPKTNFVEITIKFDNHSELVIWGIGPEMAVGAVRDVMNGTYDFDGRNVIEVSIDPHPKKSSL
jgi:hypothetical protein